MYNISKEISYVKHNFLSLIIINNNLLGEEKNVGSVNTTLTVHTIYDRPHCRKQMISDTLWFTETFSGFYLFYIDFKCKVWIMFLNYRHINTIVVHYIFTIIVHYIFFIIFNLYHTVIIMSKFTSVFSSVHFFSFNCTLNLK